MIIERFIISLQVSAVLIFNTVILDKKKLKKIVIYMWNKYVHKILNINKNEYSKIIFVKEYHRYILSTGAIKPNKTYWEWEIDLKSRNSGNCIVISNSKFK